MKFWMLTPGISTHWVGGMGVLVFIMAFIPLSGGQNMHIMKAESPGPSVSKLVPRVRTTALILYSIYLGMTLVMFVVLLFGDITPFEALNTAFATAGTGGFGFRNDSFASMSPYVQVVVTVFMLLFSVNFSCYYLLLLGRVKDAFNTELRWFLYIVGGAILLLTLNARGMYASWGETLRHAAFTVGTLLSTTGFATTDYATWSEVSRALVVLLMFIGACAGSTGGGFKVSRLVILLRSACNEIGNLVHPRRVKRVVMDGHPVDGEVIRATNVYLMCYFLLFAASVLLVSFENHDLITNFTAVLSAMNNIGPGLGAVGPTGNFGFFSAFGLVDNSSLVFESFVYGEEMSHLVKDMLGKLRNICVAVVCGVACVDSDNLIVGSTTVKHCNNTDGVALSEYH